MTTLKFTIKSGSAKSTLNHKVAGIPADKSPLAVSDKAKASKSDLTKLGKRDSVKAILKENKNANVVRMTAVNDKSDGESVDGDNVDENIDDDKFVDGESVDGEIVDGDSFDENIDENEDDSFDMSPPKQYGDNAIYYLALMVLAVFVCLGR
jgi:hypothetical protein